MSDQVHIREATEADVGGIRGIFEAVYSEDYPYRQFLDLWWLKRSVFTDDILLLVAEDEGTEQLLGTASVVFDIGAHSDLLGEFGRLAVHPDARGRGVGRKLMDARCSYVSNRLHIGIVQNRCVHPYSQRISRAHGFAPVGFLPMKYAFTGRESASLWCRHFGPGLKLRRNHPRLVPEAVSLANTALENCGLEGDAIVDEDASAYPHGGSFVVQELTEHGMPSLLRIERGRVRGRDIFGPMQLQYGFFQISNRKASYLIAHEAHSDGSAGSVVGALGYIVDPVNQAVQLFELIRRDEQAVRFLLDELMRRCEGWGTQYIEVDVSAHAPRMQRTLIELGFLPAAYVPAMVFDAVERLDVVKMVRLNTPLDIGDVHLIPESRILADMVITRFSRQHIVPRLARAMGEIALFDGLNDEEARRLAGMCHIEQLESGERVFAQADAAAAMYVILDGVVALTLDGREVATLGPGDVLGEVSLLTEEAHSLDATASQDTTLAVLSRDDLDELSRLRPDICLRLYRNLAVGLGNKLRQVDALYAGALEVP